MSEDNKIKYEKHIVSHDKEIEKTKATLENKKCCHRGLFHFYIWEMQKKFYNPHHLENLKCSNSIYDNAAKNHNFHHFRELKEYLNLDVIGEEAGVLLYKDEKTNYPSDESKKIYIIFLWIADILLLEYIGYNFIENLLIEKDFFNQHYINKYPTKLGKIKPNIKGADITYFENNISDHGWHNTRNLYTVQFFDIKM